MSFELENIVLLGVVYVAILFGIAYATNRQWIPTRITRHPITYVLSLGIFFSAWSFYGVIDLANRFGYGALAYYMGIGAFFLFAPMIQAPLAELCQRFQLRSIADLLVFRYSSQTAGSLATLCMLLAILPLLVIQIQAIADTLQILTSNTSLRTSNFKAWIQQRDITAFFYCLLIASFCMIFGASYRQYSSLITTMAFESLIKILAMLLVGLFAVFGVFGGFGGLDQWLAEHPEHLNNLHNPDKQSSSHTLLLVFLASSIVMPHIFHMSNINMATKQISRTVTWAFPLMLFIVAIPVFPILWAGFKLEVPYQASYFTLVVPMASQSATLTMIAYIGGVSAASGALIVAILSLSRMIANHWVLPLFKLKKEGDIYAQLRWLQRGLILSIAMLGYGAYQLLDYRLTLVDLALVTFIQALQFLPGVVAITYFPSANRHGFYAGILAGTAVWAFSFVTPMLTGQNTFTLPIVDISIGYGVYYWENITIISLASNLIIFALVSRFTTMSDEEHYHAELCAEDELSRPFRRSLNISSVKDFIDGLEDSIGASAAEREVQRALDFLQLTHDETRPYALRRLRTRIQANLASLMGQSVAVEMMDHHFPYTSPQHGEVLDINLMENRLERMGDNIHGLTADVNQLRLYHRNTLQELPIAICSLGMDDEILLWNHAMGDITGIDGRDVTGSNLNDLPKPWGQLIHQFANSAETHTDAETNGTPSNLHENPQGSHWYRLHKSAVQESWGSRTEGQVVLIEDITERHQLEQQLTHNTRLASIGRLAAGVAHEIGNPVTGIACLAQNLKYEDDAEGREETAQAILSQTDRITRIVQSLVTFAHTGQSSQKDFHKVSIHRCADEAIHLLSMQKERKQIEYRNLCDEAIFVLGDTQRIIQVFINLLSNANDASPDYSTITLQTTLKSPFVHIDVIDEGSGIEQDHIQQIMDPFFTTKEAGKGTGLGLSVVFSIIGEHEGQMDITSPVTRLGGTCFTIKLPLLDEALETLSQPLHTTPPNNEQAH
ncbi:ATP-binding protein [Eionea flava]